MKGVKKDKFGINSHYAQQKAIAERVDCHYVVKDWKTGTETKYPDEQTATLAQIDASLEAKSAYRFTRYKVPGSM